MNGLYCNFSEDLLQVNFFILALKETAMFVKVLLGYEIHRSVY